MSLGTAAVAGLAMILGLGGVSTFVLSDDQSNDAQEIQMEDEGIKRQDQDASEIVAKDDDGDDDGDDTKGNDGTSGGNNTGDGDNTRGNDGTSGGDNTGDGDNTRGNDGTSGGDNTVVRGGGGDDSFSSGSRSGGGDT